MEEKPFGEHLLAAISHLSVISLHSRDFSYLPIGDKLAEKLR